ncbi:NADH-quinone oxidoreductase subunit L [Denitromonas iodatirespirans]|uniref:NADH-quinone oxidoreductase subunit L n=1 Tax=Denitromonas iodatirespirans TaxID=2795389 RepID=A0A944HDI8_DENI1|nr:NADH-quinone oxidoreductase subunit L [Denitromonas iodatirespirans]MBT0963787.1 NADH-quinone oxidoreductase subunit L [Denitromonas iodatirespirans]
MSEMNSLYLVVPLAPLAGAILAGLFGKVIGRTGAHIATILGVAVAFVASVLIYQDVQAGNTFNGTVYTWATSGNLSFEVGFLIDELTVMMMLVVTFVSLMVHVYTIGYMHEDPGYQRFFSYISLFTFSMLMLVMSNNFLQLFFGWEAVGLVSYLLIGFWYTRPTAIFANMKAFLVNRVGDFGFLLGIGLVAAYTGSLNYAEVFSQADALAAKTIELFPGAPWLLISVICICLFIGAMGKSAQVPLHVWLPDSMEGPTPISALIHAATMVTAGIFMVARMSPLFELSETALSFVIVIGATTALFMGFLGIVQNDIKRVVAYSTLSQLGYMTVALGVSAYSAAVFHLMTHAFFKALLFLGAGSVIIGMHHDQDMRNMGGLWKYMPITWFTSLVGSLALIGFPFFAGFFSKDSIIEAVHFSQIPGAGYAYVCVIAGVFITAFYSFRMYFLVFHGKERFGQTHHDHHGDHDDEEPSGDHHHGLAPGQKPHESPWVVTVPLILLAIPSVLIGFMTIEPMLFGEWFKRAIHVAEAHDTIGQFAEHFHGAAAMAIHGFTTLPFFLAMAGVVVAWFFYLVKPEIPAAIMRTFKPLHTLLDNKYYFDKFNEVVFAGGSRLLGQGLWKGGDQGVIDGLIINGTARSVSLVAQLSRLWQSGHIYLYAFSMIIGVCILLSLWFSVV